VSPGGVRWIVLLSVATAVWALAATTPAKRASPAGVPRPQVAAPEAAVRPAPRVRGSGVTWSSLTFPEAAKQAKERQAPILLEMMAPWCHFCKSLDATVWFRPDVGEAASSFIAVKLDGEKHPDLVKRFGVEQYPTIIFLSPNGREPARIEEAVPYTEMLSTLQRALQKSKWPGMGSSPQ
jgi:thiol:disulfide interchange protein